MTGKAVYLFVALRYYITFFHTCILLMDQPWSNCFQLRYKQLQNQLLSKTHLTWTLASCNGRASRSWAVTLRNKSRTYQLTNYHCEHHNWKSSDKANITFNFWWIHVEIMESLSKQPFWAMDGKRKWTFCMPGKWSLPNFQTNHLSLVKSYLISL